MAACWESELRRQYGPAGARLRAQARADARASSKRACAGPHITPGYWRAAGADREGVRRGRLLQDRRRAEIRGPGRTRARASCSTAASPRTSSSRTGTWVSVGPLRARLIEHFAPYVRDVVIAGADRDDIGVLIFPDLDGLPRACRRPADRRAGRRACSSIPTCCASSRRC